MKFDSLEHEVIYEKIKKGITPSAYSSNIKDKNISNASEQENYLREIHQYIEAMSRTRENYAYRYLHSHRKWIGRWITFSKKVIRRSLKWYIEPIANQQSTFNSAATPAIGRVAQIIQGVLDKETYFESEIKALQQQLKHEQKQMEETITRQNASIEEILINQKHYLEEADREHKAEMNYYKTIINDMQNKLEKISELGFIDNKKENFFIKETYAQSGEDSILAYIIRVLGIPFDQVEYVDLGANHAKEMSNTFYFYTQGAKGILVEANNDLLPELKFYRHRDLILNNCVDIISDQDIEFYILSGDGLSTPDYNSALSFCEKNPDLKIIDKRIIRTISYNDIIERYLGRAPTILSIDIEGKDDEILHSIDFSSKRPIIIVTEMIQYDTILAHNTRNNDIKKYLEANEYEEYAFTGINSIFIDRKYLEERQMYR